MFAEMKGLAASNKQRSWTNGKILSSTVMAYPNMDSIIIHFKFQHRTVHTPLECIWLKCLLAPQHRYYTHSSRYYELVAGPNSGKLVLSKLKNTMSDRHVVEKKFSDVLKDHHRDILATIIDSYEQMIPDEQGSISTLNNFFCGMHMVVGMADTASSVLL